jgi:hypothetical protein
MNFISSSEALSKNALKGMYSIKSYMYSLSELPVNMDTYKEYYNATLRATKLITLISVINAFLTKFTTNFVNIF